MSFVNTETNRIAFTGPNGEGALAPNDPRVQTMPGLVSWVQPNGQVSYYLPGQNIQQGNIGALRAWEDSQLPEEPTVTIDYRAEAAAMYPWLTGSLLSQYGDLWADTGSPGAALSKLRNTAEYGRIFQGIFREDGTMRMDENTYFATKVGYREALAEFGRNPALYESKLNKLIVNEVSAQEFLGAVGESVARFVEPGASIDNGLTDLFLDRFIDTGSTQVALAEIRESAIYGQVFAGNRREDGSLRMDEADYFAYKRGWMRTLSDFGLNPGEFLARDRLRESVEGEISVQELNQRLQITQDGILDNVDAVRSFYAENYGIDLNAESILGMSIDPDIQRDVLERRITAGQIGGEASIAGFRREISRAEELARMGLDQSRARQLYSQAGSQLGGLSATTQRFGLGATSIGDYEQGLVGQDSSQTDRWQNALQREASNFSSTSDVRRSQDGLGLAGLRQR